MKYEILKLNTRGLKNNKKRSSYKIFQSRNAIDNLLFLARLYHKFAFL
jgi:hypothetical protein